MFQRIQRLQQRLRADGVDGVLYATSSNMQYFLENTRYPWHRTPYTGFAIPGPNGHQANVPDCVLYIPADDAPVPAFRRSISARFFSSSSCARSRASSALAL